MGDRCYVTLYIHGELASPKQLVGLYKALTLRGWEPYDNRDNVLGNVAEAVFNNEKGGDHAGKYLPMFEFEEVNYGNIDEIEDALQDADVLYSVDQGPGGEYGPETRAWSPERGRVTCQMIQGGTAAIEVDELVKAREEGRLDHLIDDAKFATGALHPPFTVGDKVRRLLAKHLAKEALNLKAA